MGEQGEKQLWTGPCIGGPLGVPSNTTSGQSRYPKGFVYVDMPNQLVWIYEWHQDDPFLGGNPYVGKFYVRDERPAQIDKVKLRALRDRHDWDIRTAEEEVSRVYAGTTGTGQNS